MSDATENGAKTRLRPGALPKRKSPFDEYTPGLIADLIDDGIPDPIELIPGLVYEGGSHTLAGHPKDGKSWIGLFIAVEAMKLGRPVVWCDFEMGPRRIAKRCEELGVDTSLLRDHFHYFYAPLIRPQDPELSDDLHALVERFPSCVVVFDSQAKALAVAGMSEDKADEITQWMTKIVLELSNVHEATTIVIDHVTKDATSSNRYGSRGSGAKAADADVTWYVEALDPHFDRHTDGVVKLTRKQDRDGCMPRVVAFSMISDDELLFIQPLAEVPAGAAAASPVLDSTKSKTLNTLNKHPDGLSFGKLREKTGATEKMQTKALQELAAEKKVAKGEGHLDPWRSLEPRL